MNRKYLLDASALLALIHSEPGADQVLARNSETVTSSRVDSV
jgi:PIN domain nuclease of toxin-antitoxin system